MADRFGWARPDHPDVPGRLKGLRNSRQEGLRYTVAQASRPAVAQVFNLPGRACGVASVIRNADAYRVNERVAIGGETRSIWEQLGGEAGLQHLLRHFYADVRQDTVLGPVFATRIQDWPAHLERIGSFWARQLGAPSNYSGGFAGVHLTLGIEEEHFQHWLRLWERNCRQHLSAEPAEWMIRRAHEIGSHLRRILAGTRGIQIGGQG